jgi:RimJ/RimL family protein N-acetyltransferase
MIQKEELVLRRFEFEDIEYLINYWYQAAPKDIEALNVDPKRLLPENFYRSYLEDEVAGKNGIQSYLTVVIKGKPVGVYLVNQIRMNESGVFHAHIWEKEWRGQGLSTFAYPMACNVFFERFGFKKIIFKTPVNNLGALRVKEKLGISVLGEEVLNGFGLIKDGTRVRIFELHSSEICKIK